MTDSITAPTEAPTPPDAEPGKSARTAVLDHLGDTVEAGPQTRQQIVEAMPTVDPNAVDQALFRLIAADEVVRIDRGLYRLADPKPKVPPSAQAAEQAALKATTPPLAVSPADVDLFRSLLEASNGRVITNQPPGTGIRDLDMVKSMLANGADLEQDILPVLRRHVDELTQRPLESWTAPWFVAEIAESRRRRLEKPAPSPPADDVELFRQLLTAGNGNVSPADVIKDLRPIRAMLAAGVVLDDILVTLRGQVDRRSYPKNQTLASWGEPWFLKAVAELHAKHVVVPTLVEKWSKTARGEPIQRLGVGCGRSTPGDGKRTSGARRTGDGAAQ